MKKKNRSFFWMTQTSSSYIENMYSKYLSNPNSVHHSWSSVFLEIKKKNENLNLFSKKKKNDIFLDKLLIDDNSEKLIKKNVSIKNKIKKLISSFQKYGHLYSKINPLKNFKKEKEKSLDIKSYCFSNKDLSYKLNTSNFSKKNSTINVNKLYKKLLNNYCGSIGFEYMHVQSKKEKKWLYEKINNCDENFFLNSKKKIELLRTLIKSEILEQFLAKNFPGIKRFSLEGLESLIPILNEIINFSKKNKIFKIILGMAHRGRLNVLVNVFKKPIEELFFEFSNNYYDPNKNGDVKYHIGRDLEILNDSNEKFIFSLKPNPSHLEIINPFIMGVARAEIENIQEQNITNYQEKIIPISIHGDAAISGQGVIQETLNMSQTRAFSVGGTIHIILNNQIGFTTSKNIDLRSTKYSTDVAKMINSPVFHVNADDPEAVVFVTKLACIYRKTFKKDVFIDLVGYRRRGHNEVDDPTVTQPKMYKKIAVHPTVTSIFYKKLEKEKIINIIEKDKILINYTKKMDLCYEKSIKEIVTVIKKNQPNTHHFCLKEKFDLSYEKLKKIALKINKIPNYVSMHHRVKKIYNERIEMALGNIPFDWGGSECLAYAIFLKKGISCRIIGEDTQRGTFFHRHAVIHNQDNQSIYIPLKNICENQGNFRIYDSVLSELSTLAFEYGFSTVKKSSLTVWEAQFGDFINSAQVVIDQFISSSKQKWGYSSNLVIFLPHGYEGQGPEHSSARIERFLQLSAENNMQICVPTTAGQIFHLLLRQIEKNISIPLIIMTPKSLLRNPLSKTHLKDLSNGKFKKIIIENYSSCKKNFKKIVFCTGKVFYDLISYQIKNKIKGIIFCRIEQLYPFPKKEIQNLFKKVNFVKKIIWCQEEPENQGSWQHIQYNFKKIIPNYCNNLIFIGRPRSSVTAVGYIYVHKKQQRKIIESVFNL
ncbi:2-oxoglutarate dehydrogenase E1 component [Buchnera aphidicola (Tetraneura ulmi)]|uniref:2-oxoglutarate dehydrogenase E1 component n=1 Tax=Buchnera aphidicola TaxID=9 RepID=UPI00346417BE